MPNIGKGFKFCIHPQTHYNAIPSHFSSPYPLPIQTSPFFPMSRERFVKSGTKRNKKIYPDNTFLGTTSYCLHRICLSYFSYLANKVEFDPKILHRRITVPKKVPSFAMELTPFIPDPMAGNRPKVGTANLCLPLWNQMRANPYRASTFGCEATWGNRQLPVTICAVLYAI